MADKKSLSDLADLTNPKPEAEVAAEAPAEAAALFAILFLWQFPHFYAIAWLYREDYGRAGIRMLPVVDPSGERTARQILEGKHPERVLEKAVERMIPRGPLGRDQMRALHLYNGTEHPHGSQNPEILDVASMNRKNKVGA